MERETCYAEWMEHLTQNAVERALQCHSKSQSTSELEIGGGDVGPHLSLSRSVSVNASSMSRKSFGQSTKWRLEVNLDDRKNMAAGIYDLLLQWKPDTSGQWASRAGAAVPVFEDALYQKASNIEEYKNVELLDVHLRQILCEFESGHGAIYCNQSSSETCLGRSASEAQGRLHAAIGKFIGARNFAKNMRGVFSKIKQIRNGAASQNQTSVDEGLQRCPDSDDEELTGRKADKALWDAFLNGNWKEMEESVTKFQNCVSKNSARRIAGLLSLKKQSKSVVKMQVLQKGWGQAVREKMKVFSLESQKANEDKVVEEDHEDPHHAQKESTNAEQKTGSIHGLLRSCMSVSAFVRGIDSDEDLFANDSSFASRGDLQTSPRSFRLAMFLNKKDKEAGEQNENSEIAKDVDFPQAQLHLESSLLTSENIDDSPCLPSDSESNQNLKELINSQQHQQDLISLRELFQQDDGESFVSFHQPMLSTTSLAPIDGQVNTSGCRTAPIVPQMAENSQEQQEGNTEQITHTGATSFTDASITGNPVLRLQSDSLSVTLLTLLREGDPIDDRVSLMSLLRERDNYEVVVFDQDMLASINNTDIFQSDDNQRPSELHAVCCVCMVGQRGAAFVPCGHTFCRKCADELQMSRGTCPVCNRTINQILKLY